MKREVILLSREISLLHPEIRTKCQELIKKCKTRGIDIIISQTLRTKAEQDAIYAQGRTKPGKILSNVRYPKSMHCWGLAFDVAVIRSGKAIWDTAAYKPVGELGEKIGLEWGGRWTKFPDAPHFQLPNFSIAALIKAHVTPNNFIKTWPKEVAKNVAGFEKDTKVIYGDKKLDGGILAGKTYVEVRAIAETLGLKVGFDEKTKIVSLSK